MRLRSSIIKVLRKVKQKRYKFKSLQYFWIDSTLVLKRSFGSIFVVVILFALSTSFSAQSIAIISPEKTTESKELSEAFSEILSQQFKVIDSTLSDVVFQSKDLKRPFNLSVEESKNLGAGIGSNYFILFRSNFQRRSSFARNEYYESSLALYLVSSRSGKLVAWRFKKFEEDTEEQSRTSLKGSLQALVKETVLEIGKNEKLITDPKILRIDGNHYSDITLRQPLPYKRIKPKYTELAALYDIEATVDIEIEVDEKGEISEAEIVRWAGYGLDESVLETVKEMQWRPGERNGKAFPMKILLRYNFRNIETEE